MYTIKLEYFEHCLMCAFNITVIESVALKSDTNFCSGYPPAVLVTACDRFLVKVTRYDLKQL